MVDQPIDGRLAAGRLGVGDARRAAAFFGDLFGRTFADRSLPGV
jgi:hypothetical protein